MNFRGCERVAAAATNGRPLARCLGLWISDALAVSEQSTAARK